MSCLIVSPVFNMMPERVVAIELQKRRVMKSLARTG
jgi:hypothetical protein